MVEMFGGNPYSVVGKTKIIEPVIFFYTFHGDGNTLSGIGYGIVCQITEDGLASIKMRKVMFFSANCNVTSFRILCSN